MTTITIKDGKKTFSQTSFENTKDLFEYLINSFTDNTILIKTSTAELNDEERSAWKKHKKDGYDDFIDLKE